MFGSRQSWCSDCWPVRCPRMSARRRPRQPARPALTMLSGSAATRSRTWREPRRALQKTGAALVCYAGQPSRAAVRMRAIIVAGMVEDGLRLSTKCRNRGKTLGSLVARMERSVIRGQPVPDYAALHPGYGLRHQGSRASGRSIDQRRMNASLPRQAAEHHKTVETVNQLLLS